MPDLTGNPHNREQGMTDLTDDSAVLQHTCGYNTCLWSGDQGDSGVSPDPNLWTCSTCVWFKDNADKIGACRNRENKTCDTWDNGVWPNGGCSLHSKGISKDEYLPGPWVRCRHCNHTIRSEHRNDKQRCPCGAILVAGGAAHHRCIWPFGEQADHMEAVQEAVQEADSSNPDNYRPSVVPCCAVCRWWQKTWECWHNKRLVHPSRGAFSISNLPAEVYSDPIGPPARPLAVCDLYEVLDA